jgi:hypothetical protein
MKSSVPTRLYKYQVFGPRALENLKSRQIWFCAPARFNDPFDCALSVIPDDLSDADLVRAYEYIKMRMGNDPAFDLTFATDGKPNDRFRSDVLNGVKSAFADLTRKNLEEHGVACFSEIHDSLLMWAHYADGHRGFCLEFDATMEPFSKARRVIYQDTLPSLNPVDVLEDVKQADPFEPMLLTKSACWSYEREWRLVHMQANHISGLWTNARSAEDTKWLHERGQGKDR